MGVPSLGRVCWGPLATQYPQLLSPRGAACQGLEGDRSGGRAPAGTVRGPPTGLVPGNRGLRLCVWAWRHSPVHAHPPATKWRTVLRSHGHGPCSLTSCPHALCCSHPALLLAERNFIFNGPLPRPRHTLPYAPSWGCRPGPSSAGVPRGRRRVLAGLAHDSTHLGSPIAQLLLDEGRGVEQPVALPVVPPTPGGCPAPNGIFCPHRYLLSIC